MTAAELAALETVPADDFDRLRCWRLEKLLHAGYDEDDATEIAFHLDVDLHYAASLVHRGCPSDLAARIVL